MFKTLLTLATAAALATLAGCATPAAPTTALLTYETTPPGAELFEGGQSIGVAPQTRTYKETKPGEGIRSPDVTAQWPSGAKTTFFTVLQVGDDRVATLARPVGAPNLNVDLDNAAKYITAAEREKREMKREQARASARCQAQMQKGSVTDDCN